MPKAAKTAKRKSPAKKSSPEVTGDCLIPLHVPNAAINQFAFKRNDAEAQRIVMKKSATYALDILGMNGLFGDETQLSNVNHCNRR